MLKNYIKIAWRNFTRNKFYSLINVFGLSLGLACLILITLFVTDELSYDNFHENGSQIQLVAQESKFGKSTNRGLSTPFPLGSTMENAIPEVEDYITATWPGNGSVSVDGEEYIDEEHIIHSTKNFFNVFSFPLKVGNPKDVLSGPNAVVITEKMAEKYFPDEEAVGKTIHINRYDDLEFVITGIAENINKNSYLEFDFVASIERLSNVESNRDSWGSRMYQTYVSLQDGAEWKQIETGIASITETNTRKEINVQFFPIAIADLYLSDLVTAEGFKGSIKYIYIFSAISFFILLLACINYMNLATARAMKRSREVGIRKVVGAGRGQLIRQFISEAMVITLAAFLFALLLAELFLPFFNNFVSKELTLNLFSNGLFFVLLLGVAIFVGLLSGSYPAFFLSRFKPVETLKTGRNTLLTGAGLRKTLVVVQFTVSTVLIISTLIVLNQLNYVQQKDLGFEREQVMYIPASQIQGDIETFKELALKYSGVISASAATDIPGRFGMRMSAPFDPKQPDNEFAVHSLRSDADYKNVLGLQLAAGRYFLDERSTDPDTARVINEAMLKELGWGTPKEAIRKKLQGGKTVIGVLKDFHFKSLHEKISPLLIQMKPNDAGQYENYSLLTVRFNPEDVEGVISYLKKQWSSMVSEDPMTYHFLDDKFAEQYATDQKLSNAFSVFAILSVLIACMGLLGLAAFAAERRTKEIGIRKVLGATVSNIVGLLSKDFLKLVALGFIIAVPIAWYAMNKWLADFAYKIESGPGIFLLAGGTALLIALATVSWQSIRAALANPVDSLRSE